MTTPPTDMLTVLIPGLACPVWCVECQDTTPLGDADIRGHSSCKAFGEVRLTRHDRMDLAPDGTLRVTPGDVVLFLPGDDDREFTVEQAARMLVDLTAALEAITADAAPRTAAWVSTAPRASPGRDPARTSRPPRPGRSRGAR